MLLPMQPDTNSAPSANASTFAGLLAALTAPRSDSAMPPLRKSPSAWDDDGLADDVATLSYENALRARARYRALDRTDRSLTGPDPGRNPVDSYELAPCLRRNLPKHPPPRQFQCRVRPLSRPPHPESPLSAISSQSASPSA